MPAIPIIKLVGDVNTVMVLIELMAIVRVVCMNYVYVAINKIIGYVMNVFRDLHLMLVEFVWLVMM